MTHDEVKEQVRLPSKWAALAYVIGSMASMGLGVAAASESVVVAIVLGGLAGWLSNRYGDERELLGAWNMARIIHEKVRQAHVAALTPERKAASEVPGRVSVVRKEV